MQRVTDRSGREWIFDNYESPSGPAFCVTLPEEFDPPGTFGYTVHFNGRINVSTDKADPNAIRSA